MKMKKFKKSNQQGYTLVELMLVLVIISIIAAMAIIAENERAMKTRADVLAGQVTEVGMALDGYISNNYATLSNTANALPTVTISSLIASRYLPADYKDTNIAGNYNIQLRRVAGTDGNQIVYGLVSTDTWNVKGKIDYTLLNRAANKIGVLGGVTLFSADNVTGSGGTWTETKANFPTVIKSSGQLFYRTWYGINSGSPYLRRDGTLPMIGNLNMNNNDINNIRELNTGGQALGIGGDVNAKGKMDVTGKVQSGNTSYTPRVDHKNQAISGVGTPNVNTGFSTDGVVSALQVVADRLDSNFLNTNYINAEKDTLGVVFGDPTDTTVAALVTTTKDGYYTGEPTPTNGVISVKDIYIRNIHGNNSGFLSDLLPRYISVGAFKVDNTVNNIVIKPQCNHGMIPKIIITPQTTQLTSYVTEGDIQQDTDKNITGFKFKSQGVLNNIAENTTYAGQDAWRIRLYSEDPNENIPGMEALAHIYCDRGYS